MVVMATMLLAFGSATAFAANNDAETKNVSVEMVPYDANASRELIDTVYFRSENGNTVMSETPFGSEEASPVD